MGDDADEETFETTDAGSSHTYPMEAGQIRKGGFIMIKGNACKVSDVSTSKTGKHGHAKCHFVAIDIFTGKKARRTSPPPAARRQARLSGRSDTRQGLARGVCPAWPSPPLAVPASRRLPERESSHRPAAPAAVRATR